MKYIIYAQSHVGLLFEIPEYTSEHTLEHQEFELYVFKFKHTKFYFASN